MAQMDTDHVVRGTAKPGESGETGGPGGPGCPGCPGCPLVNREAILIPLVPYSVPPDLLPISYASRLCYRSTLCHIAVASLQ